MDWETDDDVLDWQDPDAWRGGEPIFAGDEWKERFPGEAEAGPQYRLLRDEADRDDGGCC